jgi:preprotein translocase subunit SecD
VTTLITALALLWFGTGPIKGFAVTLSIGIVVSMFTALFVTRVVFDLMTRGGGARKIAI